MRKWLLLAAVIGGGALAYLAWKNFQPKELPPVVRLIDVTLKPTQGVCGA